MFVDERKEHTRAKHDADIRGDIQQCGQPIAEIIDGKSIENLRPGDGREIARKKGGIELLHLLDARHSRENGTRKNREKGYIPEIFEYVSDGRMSIVHSRLLSPFGVCRAACRQNLNIRMGYTWYYIPKLQACKEISAKKLL